MYQMEEMFKVTSWYFCYTIASIRCRTKQFQANFFFILVVSIVCGVRDFISLELHFIEFQHSDRFSAALFHITFCARNHSFECVKNTCGRHRNEPNHIIIIIIIIILQVFELQQCIKKHFRMFFLFFNRNQLNARYWMVFACCLMFT